MVNAATMTAIKTHDVRDFDYLDPLVIDPDAHLRAVESGHVDPFPFGYRQARIRRDNIDAVRLIRGRGPFRCGQIVNLERSYATMALTLSATRSPLHKGKRAHIKLRTPRGFAVWTEVVTRGRDVPVRYKGFDDAVDKSLLTHFHEDAV